ncbi:hypothetical protein AB6T85_21815 [Erwinia sp. ACCC 02193]|jgi:hypothetical protein|uniref:Uncharacterized protein n=1 Tax=Erwinia aeris TaxID=3239803 RepID=A0ABV4EDM4_9GAMM
MHININQPESWSRLPQALSGQLHDVHAGHVDYAGRAAGWQEAGNYLSQGNFSMAGFKLGQIEERQSNMRQT